MARKRGVVLISKLKLSRREKRMMYYRVGGLVGQNAISTAQGRERHTGCTLHPDLLDYKARSRLVERVVGSGAEPLWGGHPVRPFRRRARVRVMAGHKSQPLPLVFVGE